MGGEQQDPGAQEQEQQQVGESELLVPDVEGTQEPEGLVEEIKPESIADMLQRYRDLVVEYHQQVLALPEDATKEDVDAIVAAYRQAANEAGQYQDQWQAVGDRSKDQRGYEWALTNFDIEIAAEREREARVDYWQEKLSMFGSTEGLPSAEDCVMNEAHIRGQERELARYTVEQAELFAILEGDGVIAPEEIADYLKAVGIMGAQKNAEVMALYKELMADKTHTIADFIKFLIDGYRIARIEPTRRAQQKHKDELARVEAGPQAA